MQLRGAVAFLWLCSAFFPPASRAGGSLPGSPLPLPFGDWVVTTPQIYSDVTITLRGNLIVQRGGSLDLHGVWLRLEGSRDGERRIEVRNGGALYARSSSITGRRTEIGRGDGPGRYAFHAAPSARLLLIGASVSGAGWDEAHPGLVIEGSGEPPTRDVSLLDCDFHDNFVGVTLRSFSGVILASRFRENERAGVALESAPATLSTLEITGQPVGIMLSGDGRAQIAGSVITENEIGLVSHGAEFELGYSILAGNGTHARLEGPAGADVHDNVFAVGAGAVLAAGGATPVLAHNDILQNGFGVRNEQGDAGPSVLAVENYWGAGSGPSGAGPGEGDSVSPGVDFTPWCTESCTRARRP